MSADRWPLSDLSFFRFPELTTEVVRNIVVLVLVLVLTVVLTVLVQNRVQHWLRMRAGRSRFDRFAGKQHMPPPQRAVLVRMMRYAGTADEFAFMHDAAAFELAAERLVSEGDDALVADLGRLRKTLHLNVMNPEVALVSTRQLLPDQPVRLVAHIGEDRLDVYCVLLRVDERSLLIDPPQQDEILRLLESHPHVLLLHWREREGEALFRVTLEPVEDGKLAVFQARHAFRDAETESRSAFRLTTDLPLVYRFLERSELGRLRGRKPGSGTRSEGEGRVVDLSYGGAALAVAEPLEERGLAQLRFDLQGKSVRLMLEVLSSAPRVDGGFLVRGQFRGLGEETRVSLHNVLYREQIKRLRERQWLHVRSNP